MFVLAVSSFLSAGAAVVLVSFGLFVAVALGLVATALDTSGPLADCVAALGFDAAGPPKNFRISYQSNITYTK